MELLGGAVRSAELGGEGPHAKKREYSFSSTILVGRTEKPGSNG